MELEDQLQSFQFWFCQQFAIGEEETHKSRQQVLGKDKPGVPYLRYDTKEYPWPLFERFVKELYPGWKVAVEQRIEVTRMWLQFEVNNKSLVCEPEYQTNYEFETTTSFLFYKDMDNVQT